MMRSHQAVSFFWLLIIPVTTKQKWSSWFLIETYPCWMISCLISIFIHSYACFSFSHIFVNTIVCFFLFFFYCIPPHLVKHLALETCYRNKVYWDLSEMGLEVRTGLRVVAATLCHPWGWSELDFTNKHTFISKHSDRHLRIIVILDNVHWKQALVLVEVTFCGGKVGCGGGGKIRRSCCSYVLWVSRSCESSS